MYNIFMYIYIHITYTLKEMGFLVERIYANLIVSLDEDISSNQSIRCFFVGISSHQMCLETTVDTKADHSIMFL